MTGYLGLDTDKENLTFGGFVADIARRYGDGEALIFGDRRITFRQLEDEVRQFARALLAAGVTKGSSVAIMLANRPEFVIAAYGAGSIGAVVVPVSTFAPSDERDYILRHSDASRPRHPGVAVQPPLRRRAARQPPRARPRASRDSCARRPSRSSGASSRSTRRPRRPSSTGTTWSHAPTRCPRSSSTRRWPRCTRATPASSSTPRARAPTPRACCTPTAPRSSRAGAGARRWASRPTTSCSASSRTSGRRVSP